MEKLYLTELYPSIQGETLQTGIPTTFVRLSGCNLRCHWCDTPHSFPKGEETSLESLIAEIEAFGLAHVCITGGEPLLQKPVLSLMKALCDKDYTLSLETGGSLPISDVDPRVHVILDIKCPGSGMMSHNLLSNLPLLKPKDQIKFVLNDRTDYDFAKQMLIDHKIEVGATLFSPVHGILDPKDLTKWIIEDKLNSVRVNLQLHKYIWEPQTLGV